MTLRATAACLRALVGEGAQLTVGLRLVFEPTFHEPLVVVVGRTPGIVELHLVSRDLVMATFWRGRRLVVPDPREVEPAAHPSDLAEVGAEALAPVFRAASRLPSDANDAPRSDTRDGMRVSVEHGDRVLGAGYPVGEGPEAHTELARAVLALVLEVFPAEHARVAPLVSYLPTSARASR
ncbi:MAG: hypothetical protein U0183_09660 [Polyangiaceae bacterium]